MPDKRFFTVTMAKIQEEQGNFEKAEEIYRDLLNKDPDNEDLRAALNRIANIRTGTAIEHLVPLFREWVETALEYRKLKTLRKLRGGMG